MDIWSKLFLSFLFLSVTANLCFALGAWTDLNRVG